MSTVIAELEQTARLLRRDVEATVGAAYVALVRQSAANVLGLDIDDFSQKCVDDVQQHLQDTYVDTTWPSCPRHPNHPMVYEAGSWWCPRDRVALFRLGELPSRSGADPVSHRIPRPDMLAERADLLADIEAAETQLERGEGLSHEAARARVLSRLPRAPRRDP